MPDKFTLKLYSCTVVTNLTGGLQLFSIKLLVLNLGGL